jgi:hypothetical protein
MTQLAPAIAFDDNEKRRVRAPGVPSEMLALSFDIKLIRWQD